VIRLYSSSGKRLSDQPLSEILHMEAAYRIDVKRDKTTGEPISAKFLVRSVRVADLRPTGTFRVRETEHDIAADGRRQRWKVRHRGQKKLALISKGRQPHAAIHEPKLPWQGMERAA
jgi:hypothetical protein